MSSWPFAPLQPGQYDLLFIDPPWKFKKWSEANQEKSPEKHYDTMSIEDIFKLPVASLAKPDCLLWLWATHPMINVQMECLLRWGFTFKTSGVWVKRTVNDKLAFGTGYIFRCASEPILIGTIGKPKTTRVVRTVIEGLIREHSRKPEEAYREAERLMPDARRADIFSRETRAGWDSWGNEVGKFG